MAGELWRSTFQIGKETTAGTNVAATRKMYFRTDGSRLTREREPRAHRFATTTRDNVRAFTLGPYVIGGTLIAPLSASEIIELLLMGIKAAVTPTGAGSAKLWTFTPGETLEPATIEWQDGARAWEAGGCVVNKLKIAGNVREECTVEAEVFGMNMSTTTLTGALAERTPDFIEGWETKLYIDTFGGTAGSTQITGTLINWDIEIDNQLGRKYFAANTLNLGAVAVGELLVTAKLMFEASSATSATEFTNWDAATKRLVRLMFGDNEVISGADKKFVTVDIPGAWDAFDLGGTDEGTRTYELGLQYIYDSTNAYGLQIRAQNARTTAW
jgi:hypothetical protein